MLQALILICIEFDNLPQIPMSPQRETSPIVSPHRVEINYQEELKKGSKNLREEVSQNLQKIGGNYKFDFYGGNERMDFSSRNDMSNHVSKPFGDHSNNSFRLNKKTWVISITIKLNGICLRILLPENK